MQSTLAGWLQHMPALPRFLLKLSDTHNFWFVIQIIWNLFSCQAYCEAHVHKGFKIKKIKIWDQVTLLKTNLSSIHTFSLLGVKRTPWFIQTSTWYWNTWYTWSATKYGVTECKGLRQKGFTQTFDSYVGKNEVYILEEDNEVIDVLTLFSLNVYILFFSNTLYY
jgi:hypothetical protein